MFDCKILTHKRKKIKKLESWTVVSDSISPKDNKAHEAVRRRAAPWGQRSGSRLVFPPLLSILCPVVTVSQTTQITGPVWHGHTPSSGYTHAHLKLAGPRLHNRCFLRSSGATWNPKPPECVWVNDATRAKAPALAGCTLLPQRREKAGGERKQAEVGGRAAKRDQNWDSAAACL